MEKVEGNGGVRLPIGFRFRPTDEELVVHYLRRKVCSMPLPATVIPDFDDVFHSNPWDLPGELKEKRYFFNKTRAISTSAMKYGSCTSLRTGCGYWKPVGKDRQIAAPGTNMVIGIKKSMVFYRPGSSSSSSPSKKTQWIMHVFCLVGSVTSPFLAPQMKVMMQVGEWVVCRVYQRRKKPAGRLTQAANGVKDRKRSLPKGLCPCASMGMMGRNGQLQLGLSFAQTSPSSSLSCSSEITTDISSNDLDQEASSLN